MVTTYTLFKNTRIIDDNTKTRHNWMTRKDDKKSIVAPSEEKRDELSKLKEKRSSLLQTIRNSNVCQPATRRRRATFDRHHP